jgi:2-polyprenyl-3-methyl-5-hydroxy-6-metoxy-1,4-benzoquinol methylase
MEQPANEKKLKCRLCGSEKIRLVKKSKSATELVSQHFAITDSNYGETLDIYSCADCGLLQCLQVENIEKFYRNLEDQGYEDSREERLTQTRKILGNLKKYLPAGRILDVGAGSGILVEEALKAGYEAIGLEPSAWLQQKAAKRNLPVLVGVLPDDRINGQFDAVTLIDVIEHVEKPLELLAEIKKRLKPEGFLILTTPDVDSFFAKMLKWKWWHFRVAHISYFNKKTLSLLLAKAGFEIVDLKRPNWYFALDYLFERIKKYLPGFLRFKTPALFKKIIIPLNLFDSFEIICRIKK